MKTRNAQTGLGKVNVAKIHLIWKSNARNHAGFANIGATTTMSVAFHGVKKENARRTRHGWMWTAERPARCARYPLHLPLQRPQLDQRYPHSHLVEDQEVSPTGVYWSLLRLLAMAFFNMHSESETKTSQLKVLKNFFLLQVLWPWGLNSLNP